jgi:hypothetical protein
VSKATPKQSPVHSALSMFKVDGFWVVVEYKIQDGKIISTTQLMEPDVRMIANERFRINAANIFFTDL